MCVSVCVCVCVLLVGGRWVGGGGWGLVVVCTISSYAGAYQLLQNCLSDGQIALKTSDFVCVCGGGLCLKLRQTSTPTSGSDWPAMWR